MANTYKDSSLLIDRLERKFKKKVRWSLNRRQIEPQRHKAFLDFLDEDEFLEEDQQGDNSQTQIDLIY
jgi:hypothetical protein